MCFFECAETGKKAGFCDSALTIYYNPFCRKSQCFWKTVKTLRVKQDLFVEQPNDFETVAPKRLLQLSAAGEVFLEGTCPLSRCPQTAKFPVPMLLGTGRRWVRKAIAFRGRSEQDRSALCPACSTATLETFRWNVSNGIFLATKTPDTAQSVPNSCLP